MSWCNFRVDYSYLSEIQLVINRRPTPLNPSEEVREAEFNRARADVTPTNHFWPGDPG
jgi:hypothetical protein